MKIIASLPAYLLTIAIFTVSGLYSQVHYYNYDNLPGSDPTQREDLYNNLLNNAGIKGYRAKPTYAPPIRYQPYNSGYYNSGYYNSGYYNNYNSNYYNSGTRVYSTSRVDSSGRIINTNFIHRD